MILNGNGSSTISPQFQVNQSKSNLNPINPEALHQQHVDFLKKYKTGLILNITKISFRFFFTKIFFFS
jgi:hypothetical protein